VSWQTSAGGWALALATGLLCGCSASQPQKREASRASKLERPSLVGVRLPEIRLVQNSARGSKAVIQVAGLRPAALTKAARANLSREKWQEILAVYTAGGESSLRQDLPAILGAYRAGRDGLYFEPDFSLEPGVRLRAVFHTMRWAVIAGEVSPDRDRPSLIPPPIEAEFQIPARPASASTIVRQVYPSTSLLPENLLKFYIHFSAPMSRAQAYENIHLLDPSGREVEAPFLELGEELWNPDGTRFTLFFDPGRVKRELKPREELGPALQEGKSYTLVVNQHWRDASGNPLSQSHQKQFRVGPPDYELPIPSSWVVIPPLAATRDPVVVEFPESLDHALLQRLLTVNDPFGRQTRGRVEITADERRWVFTPLKSWKTGTYRLVVQSTLEDLAGNSVARPFEIDIFEKVNRQIRSQSVSLPFQVLSKGARYR
jgi:hypothetical protein